MPRRNEIKPNKRPVEQYDHKGKKRLNNPLVGLVDASTDAIEGLKIRTWTRNWSGRARRSARASRRRPSLCTSHERIDPRGIIKAVRKKNGSNYEQLSLFAAREQNPPLREASTSTRTTGAIALSPATACW
jgi:adenine-specific DNA-methyltransferase